MATSRHETRFELTATDKTKAALKSAESGFNRLDGVVGKLAIGFGALAGTGAIGAVITQQVAGARQAVAYADALGVSTDALTAMQSAGETVGVGADKMADILKDTAEKIGDAYRNGGGEAVEVMESLNLNIANMAALSPDEQLLAIADALGQVQTQGEKVQIMESLASDAALLLPLLDNNAEKMRELMREADESGRTLTRIEADKMIAVGEATDRLKNSLDGLGQSLTLSLVGPLNDVIKLANRAVIGVNTLGEKFADFVVGGSEVTGMLTEAEEKLTRLETAHRMARGAAKKAAKEKVIEQQTIVEQMRITDAELRRHAEEWKKGFTPVGTVTGGDGGGGSGGAADDKLAQNLERLRASLLSEEQALAESHIRRQGLINEAEVLGIESKMGYDEMRFAAAQDFETKITALAIKGADDRAKAEQQVQAKIANMRQSVASLTVGLMRTLGKDSKEWAYATIAVEKGLSIALAIQNTAVAVTKAMALGPPGMAMIPGIKAIGATQVALIAATGLAEAANVSSGGGGISSSGAPAPVTPIDNGFSNNNTLDAPTQGAQITIRIVGDGDFKDLVVKSIEQAEANDEIRILSDG